MKANNKIYIILFLLILFPLISGIAVAKINFSAAAKNKIDLEKLSINKEQFLSFVSGAINERSPGLGYYQTVSISPCQFKLNDQKLVDYKTLKGIEAKYLSNPSCNQIVIRKILENSYDYKKENLTSYQNRRCIITFEKMLSPLFEYYTIRYEEKELLGCNTCNTKERNRLKKIEDIQKKLAQECHSEQQKVMRFFSDLDEMVEKTYQQKIKQLKK